MVLINTSYTYCLAEQCTCPYKPYTNVVKASFLVTLHGSTQVPSFKNTTWDRKAQKQILVFLGCRAVLMQLACINNKLLKSLLIDKAKNYQIPKILNVLHFKGVWMTINSIFKNWFYSSSIHLNKLHY